MCGLEFYFDEYGPRTWMPLWSWLKWFRACNWINTCLLFIKFLHNYIAMRLQRTFWKLVSFIHGVVECKGYASTAEKEPTDFTYTICHDKAFRLEPNNLFTFF